MHHMGRLHTTGKGVERNPAAAREWFLKAAKGGSVDAIVALRKDQEREWEAATRETYQMAYKAHEARDYARAAALYRTAAGAGSPGAQAALGVMIRLGQGVPKNPEAAAVLFRQAAAKGLAQAQARLGFAYEYGEGVPANWAEAAKWCQAAARQFDRLGLYCLARMYQFGIGVPQDRARAIRLFDRAMDQGDGQSKFFASWLRAPHRCVGFRNEFERQRFLFVCEDPAGMAFTSESQRHGWLAAKVREVEKAGDALRRGMDEYGSGACGAAGGSWYGGGCRGEGGRYFDPGQQDRYGRPLW
jgi:TPR repeat protein